MPMSNQPLTYPVPQDLEYVILNSLRKTDLLLFLQKHGVFIFNATKEEIAKETVKFLFDAAALEELRNLAYRTVNHKILSGFSLISNKPFELDSIYNDVRRNGILKSEGYKLNTISKINTTSDVYFEGTLSYTKKSIGRINFIREEEREAIFKMTKISDIEWKIEVDGAKSNDGKTVFTMLDRIAKKYGFSLKSMRIDLLTNTQTILFFDRLAKEALNKRWQIEDIGRIFIKREAGTKPNEEDEQEIGKEELSGITNAILEGKNLREHQFVRNAELAGYAFTSMTYIFVNKESDEKIKIRAEFKGNPKIFEVALESYENPNYMLEEGEDYNLSKLDDEVNIQIRSEFWNNAQSIYYEIINKEPKIV